MAETDLGGIVVEISADVKGLLDGSQRAAESLEQIAKSSDTTATGMQQLNQVSAAVGAALAGMSAEAKNATALLTQIAASLKATNESGGSTGINQSAQAIATLTQRMQFLAIAQKDGADAAARWAMQQKLAGQGTELQQYTAGVLAARLARMSAAQQAASGSTMNMRIAMQQAGYQVGDFLVQVQSGGNALVAFSQQASQLAGAFGPTGAIAGAVITLATIIGGQLFSSLQKGENALDALKTAQQTYDQVISQSSNGIAALSDKYAELAKTNGQVAELMRGEAELGFSVAMGRIPDDVKKASDAIFTWGDTVKAAFHGGNADVESFGISLQQLHITTNNYAEALASVDKAAIGNRGALGTLTGSVETLANKFNISQQQAFTLLKVLNELRNNPSPERVGELSKELEGLGLQGGKGADAIYTLVRSLNALVVSAAEAKKGAQDAKGAVTALSAEQLSAQQRAKEELELSKLTGAARERRRAELDAERMSLGKNDAATKQFIKSQGDMAAQAWENTNAQKEQTKAANKAASEAEAAAKRQQKAHEKDAATLKDLQAQTDVSAASQMEYARAQAVLAGQNKMSEFASPDQVKRAGQYAGKIWDANQALKANQQAQKIIAAGDVASGANPNAEINLDEQNQLAQLDAQRKLDLISFQTYQDAKTAIINKATMARQQLAADEQKKEGDAIASMLGSTSQGFEALSSIIASSAGKNSGAYKAAFAMAKAFSIAQATMALNVAILQAMAAPDSVTVGQKFANYAAIAAAGAGLLSSIASVSMGGGRKYGGSVGANSMYRVGENGPEIFQANNGNNYMIPGQGGTVLPNGSTGGGIVQNIAFTINTTGGIDNATMAKLSQMMKQVSLSTIRDQQRPNGLLQRSR